jgi:hypothetical protein
MDLDCRLLHSPLLASCIEAVETERHHGHLAHSPFFKRHGLDAARVMPPRLLASLYTQSLCNPCQANVSHLGDNSRRTVVACRRRHGDSQARETDTLLRLVPYTAKHVAQTSAWLRADEDLQDLFGVSGEDGEEEEVQQRHQHSRTRQAFVICATEQDDLHLSVPTPATSASSPSLPSSTATTPVGRIDLVARLPSTMGGGAEATAAEDADSDGDGQGEGHDAPEADTLCAHTDSPTMELDGLFIGDESRRRRGLGRAAVRLVAQYAHFVHACTTLTAVVEECNEAGMAFFPALGFEVAAFDDESETTTFALQGERLLAFVGARGGGGEAVGGEGGAETLARLEPFADEAAENDGDSGCPPHEREEEFREWQQRRIQAMKCCTLEGANVLLVPYQREHVHRYHVRVAPMPSLMCFRSDVG